MITIKTSQGINRRIFVGSALATPFIARWALAAEALNAYSIWPENCARPMFQEVRESDRHQGQLHALLLGRSAGANHRREEQPAASTCCSAVPSKRSPPASRTGHFRALHNALRRAELPARFKHADGEWTAIADDPLVFMTNTQFPEAKQSAGPRPRGTTCSIPPTRTCCRWPTRARPARR